MTTLKDVFHDLAYGELQGTAIGNLIAEDNESEPDPKSYAQLISHINAALRKVYGRFFCSMKEIYITLDESIAIYKLHSDFAESNLVSLEPIKYIADSIANPFQDDIIKIEQVFNEVGELLALNDFTEDEAIYTPDYRSIQVPWPNDYNTLAVQYRAAHPPILYSVDMDIETTDINIPTALYNAFLMYVAYRAMPRLDGGAEKQQYLQLFETECQRIDQDGLYPQAEPGDWRFDEHGWV